MKVHKHIEGSNVPTYKSIIPSCMQAQSREGTVISKGDQHDS